MDVHTVTVVAVPQGLSSRTRISARGNVEKAGYLLKGTKSGHISKANSETQKTFSKHRVELEKIWFICESETCLYVSKAMTKEANLGDLENLLKAGEIESKIFTQLKSALVKREKEKLIIKRKVLRGNFEK